MRQPDRKRLHLGRRTVRLLADDTLEAAAGGRDSFVATDRRRSCGSWAADCYELSGAICVI